MKQDENNDAGRREAYRRNIPLRLKNNWQLLKSRYNDRDRRITNAIQMKGGEALESAGGMMRHQAANLVNYGVRGLFNGSADLLGLGAKGLGGLYKTSERVENKIAEHLPGKAGDFVRNQRKQKHLRCVSGFGTTIVTANRGKPFRVLKRDTTTFSMKPLIC